MGNQKRKYNAKRALFMTAVFTIVAYFFLFREPFSSTTLNIIVFVFLMTLVDIAVYRVIKRKRRKEGENY